MESATAERLPSTSLPPIGIEIEDSLEQLGLDSTNLSPYHAGEGQDQASPKPRNRDQKEPRDKRPVKLIHHANKGKSPPRTSSQKYLFFFDPRKATA